MRQRKCIPNNAGQKKASHKKTELSTIPFLQGSRQHQIKLFRKTYTGRKAIKKIKEMIIKKSEMVVHGRGGDVEE